MGRVGLVGLVGRVGNAYTHPADLPYPPYLPCTAAVDCDRFTTVTVICDGYCFE